jgi:non-heme chloroperoxidase
MTSRRNFIGLASATAAIASSLTLTRTSSARAASTRIRTKDAVELYVKDWGAGPAVVLCHGWPLNADSWDALACAFVASGYRVIAADRRGFGRSSQPAGGYDYDTFADDLEAVLRALNVRDATLVGFSMGGGEVVRYLARYGSRRIRKAALVAAAVPFMLKTRDNPDGIDDAVFEDMKASIRRDRPAFMATLMRDVLYDVSIVGTTPISNETLDWSCQMAWQAGLLGLLACVDVFGRTDLRPDLAAVDVPTLILHGTADKPVPFAASARIASANISNSRLIEYAGAAHGILVSERERVTRDLLEFFGQ